MKDPPINRWGTVMDGLGAPTKDEYRGEGTLRRCRGCGEFYPKKWGLCPECGCAPHEFNKWLRTAQLNENLYVNAGLRKP